MYDEIYVAYEIQRAHTIYMMWYLWCGMYSKIIAITTSYQRCVPNPNSETIISDPPNLRCFIPLILLITSFVAPLFQLIFLFPSLVAAAAALATLPLLVESSPNNPERNPPAISMELRLRGDDGMMILLLWDGDCWWALWFELLLMVILYATDCWCWNDADAWEAQHDRMMAPCHHCSRRMDIMMEDSNL